MRADWANESKIKINDSDGRLRVYHRMIVAQDNASFHHARTTQHMMHANNVRMLPWPVCSLDLNPLEHVWDLLKRRQLELPRPYNLTQLERIIRRVWSISAQATSQNCIGSMRRRCQAVNRARGGHTKY